jgi:mannose-6-phosphate isomerase-like protein (cupin superfamily)
MNEDNAISICHETAEHYTWGQVCDGWHLVKNENLSVIEESMPPGTSEVRHCHARAQQFFYVLAGEAIMEVEVEAAKKEVALSAGCGLHIRPGIFHRIKNVSSQPVRFLVISQPPSHGDRVTE